MSGRLRSLTHVVPDRQGGVLQEAACAEGKRRSDSWDFRGGCHWYHTPHSLRTKEDRTVSGFYVTWKLDRNVYENGVFCPRVSVPATIHRLPAFLGTRCSFHQELLDATRAYPSPCSSPFLTTPGGSPDPVSFFLRNLVQTGGRTMLFVSNFRLIKLLSSQYLWSKETALPGWCRSR